MPKTYILIVILFFLVSCSSQQKMIKQSSTFSDMSPLTLGILKEDFISKYGTPINKDIEKLDGKIVEQLYYVEIIEKIIVTTRFTFTNDTLTKQFNSNMDYSSKSLKEIEDEIQRNRLKIIRSNSSQ